MHVTCQSGENPASNVLIAQELEFDLATELPFTEAARQKASKREPK
jgi:hypothetical protein